MSAIAALDEEECYLAAILDDPSGIDLAEFTWIDEENEDGCFRLWDFQWCLRGDTVMYTSEGRRQIKDVVGKVRLLTGSGERGEWVDAEVRSFGMDRLWRIELERRGVRRELFATARHRWFAGAGRADRRGYEETVTTDLRPGDYLQPCTSPQVPLSMERHAIQAGVVYGDGTVYGGRSRVLLHGEKRVLGQWFDGPGSEPPSSEGLYFGGLPEEYKTLLPNVEASDPSVLWGWLAGYFATDGSVLPDGTCQITSVNAEAMFHVRDVATALGVVCSAVGHRDRVTALPNGTDHALTEMRVVLRRSDLPLEFFLHPEHYQRQAALQDSRERALDAWQVVSVQDSGIDEEVFCAVVPDTHSFVLDGDILTGNSWYRCDDIYQIDFAGRSLGKSVGIQMRAYAFPFNFPGAEMLITAPELNHLRPVTDKIEHQILSHRLSREMLPKQRGNGINHQPQFQAHFSNNSRIISRLPQRDGKGVKGMHPLVIEADEMQDFPENGWIELIETMKSGTPGAQWRCHGVSKGLRDRYYKYTAGEDPDIPFTVHRYMAMNRPSWSTKERKAKIAIYGGTDDNIDYRRNIYGEHGDATNPLFVLHRLMACVRQNETPWATEYNDEVYAQVKINDEALRKQGVPIEQLMYLPGQHLDKVYTSYWAGMDVGFTRDPSEILVFGEMRHPKDKDESLLRLLTRVHLMRISADDQAEAVKHVFQFYGARLRCFAMDKSGNGLPLWQAMDPEAVGTSVHLRRTPEHIAARIRGYNFSNKVAVEFDDRPLKGKERPEDAIIEKNVVDFASDELRKLVDTGRVELPWDRELLTEWQGQEVQYVRDEGSAAGHKGRRYAGGSFHTLDASKMMIAGRNLQGIEAALNMQKKKAPRLDRFGI